MSISLPKRNLALRLAYQGTHYLGWQSTKEGPSIEGTLKAALEKLLRHPVELQAASRTDRGVHAADQVVNFFTDDPIEPPKIQRALNGMLPRDMAVTAICEMDLSFHPTLDVVQKEYRYFVCYGNVQLPHFRYLSWHIHQPLDCNLMRKVMQELVGTQNFKAFCNQRKQMHYANFVRQITRFELIELEGERLCFIIEGPNFLYKMVRTLVGTLVDIGRGKLSYDKMPEILLSEDRRLAGVTAPALGLILSKVHYITSR